MKYESEISEPNKIGNFTAYKLRMHDHREGIEKCWCYEDSEE